MTPVALARKLVGGIGDSAFASLSTFTVGFVTVRTLPDEGVALFSLLLTGYIVGMILPRYVMFNHIEIAVNKAERHVLPFLGDSVRRAAFPLVLAVVVCLLAGTPVLPHVLPSEYAFMAAGAGLSTLTGAVLLHVRSLYHVIEAHLWAGIASFVNFVVVVLVLLASIGVQGSARFVVPFGALACGQAIALSLWPLVARSRERGRSADIALLGSRLLNLVPVLSGQAGVYVQSTLVVHLLGTAASAHLEGARVAAMPVNIVTTGLAAFLMPPLVRRVGRAPDRSIIVGLVIGMGIVGALGLVFAGLLLTLGDSLSVLFGRPIDARLASARAVAFAIEGAASLAPGMYVVLSQFLRPAVLSVLAASVSVVITVLAMGASDVYAVPLGHTAASVLLLIGGIVLTVHGLRRFPHSLGAHR